MELTVSADPPALYTIDVSGGKGGQGGEGANGKPPGVNGAPGNPGAAGTITVTGPALAITAVAPIPARGDTLLGYALLAETDEGGIALGSLSVSGAMGEVESISVPLRLLSSPDGWGAAEADGTTTLTPPDEPGTAATFTFLQPDGAGPLEVVETAGGQARIARFDAGADA